MWLATVLLLAVVVAATVLLAGSMQRRASRGAAAGGRAGDLLAERYASGEITKEEYRERLRELMARDEPRH